MKHVTQCVCFSVVLCLANTIAFAQSAPSRFAYVVTSSGGVAGYAINPTSGALTPVPGSPVAVGSPSGVTVHPSGKFAYVPTSSIGPNLDVGISVYAIDGNTGSLTALQGSPFISPFLGGLGIGPAVIDPTGRFLYAVASTFGLSEIVGFTIDTTSGTLAPISGAPFSQNFATGPLAIDPTGQFLYLQESVSDGTIHLFGFSIDPTTGALTAVPGSPYPGCSFLPLTIDTGGKFAYEPDPCVPGVLGFTINGTTGSLTTVPGSPFNASGPTSVTLDPTNRFAYVLDVDCGTAGGAVTGFTIDGTTGALSEITTAPAFCPQLLAMHPTGRFAYVVNQSGILGYSIDSTTGVLAAIPGSPFPVSNLNGLTIDSTGQFLYAANKSNFANLQGIPPFIYGYFIDPITGVLTAITASPFSTGTPPITPMAITPGPPPVAIGPPTISSISPSSGIQGQTISNFTVNGSNLQPGAILSFSGDAGIAFTPITVTATQIVGNLSIAIIAGVGPRDVTVTNPEGQKATLSNALTVGLSSPPSQPAISVSPNALTFGTVSGQGSQTRTLTITNVGTAPLLLYGIGSLGNDTSAASFRVSSPIPSPINPNSSARITVTFSPFPHSIGTITAVLGITSNAAIRNTYVTMTGTASVSVNKPLSLLPVDYPLPSPPLDIQPINNHQVGNTIVTSFLIRNLTDTWYEVSLDPNDPNGPPHMKAPNWLSSASTALPQSFMIAPRQVLTFPQNGMPLVFSSGEFVQFFATNKSVNASVVFSLDMAIRGFFGTPVIPNPSTAVLSELLAFVDDVKVKALACEISAQQTVNDALANTSKDTLGWDTVVSDDVAFIGCLADNPVIVSDVQKLLQVTIGSDAATQWASIAKTLTAATVAYYFTNNFWAYMVPLALAQLTSNSPGYILLEVPFPGP